MTTCRTPTSVLHARFATPALKMSLSATEEDTAEGIVSEETNDEQRALKKTRTNKRPRDDTPKTPLSEYTVGSTVTGKVVSVMPYGAFVNIGASTDGLVHVSQLADEFVSDVESIVKVGQEVEARIIQIDLEKNKLSLSMRSERAPRQERSSGGRQQSSGSAPVPDEFKNASPEKIFKGTVASVTDFGCFVTIAEGVDALVHVSQMGEERNIVPSKFVSVGQEVEFRVQSFDEKRKRLSLSMKAYVAPTAEELAMAEAESGPREWRDPTPEGVKTAFQIAWEKAQAKAK